MADVRFPFPDKTSSMALLQRDPCCKKIAPNDVDAVFERAWDTGVREAQNFIKEHFTDIGRSMADVLRELGIALEIQDKDCVVGDIRYFCEYLSEKNTVCLYKKAVMLWAEAQELPYETAKDIILAHEHFHYIESHKIGWVSKQHQVPMVTFGKFFFGKTGIPALSEVAANAFANEVYRAIVLKSSDD